MTSCSFWTMNEPTHHANGHPSTEIDPTDPKVIAAHRKALWGALDETTAYEQSLKDERVAAELATSVAIKAIIDETGKMAFLRNGVKIQFSKRKGREVYYIKGGSEELEAVDD